jgi:hypothetical protein
VLGQALQGGGAGDQGLGGEANEGNLQGRGQRAGCEQRNGLAVT